MTKFEPVDTPAMNAPQGMTWPHELGMDTRDGALADKIRSAVASLQDGQHEPAVRHAVVLTEDIEICVYRR